MRGPGLPHDLQEIERDLPVPGMVLRHQTGQFRPVGFFRLNLVHQRQQVCRQPGCIGRRRRKAERFVGPQTERFPAQHALPGLHQPRHRKMTFQKGHCRRQRFQIRIGGQALRILVGIAHRADGRQENRPATKPLLEKLRQQARGAARRQIQRDRRQQQWIVQRAKAGDQGAVD